MNLETWFLTKLEQRLATERLIAVGSPDTLTAGQNHQLRSCSVMAASGNGTVEHYWINQTRFWVEYIE